MKHISLFLLTSFLLFGNCFSVKTAAPIEAYHLVRGATNAKSELESLTKYVFENPAKAIDFKLYLEDIYRGRSRFDIKNFWVNENDVDLNIQVFFNSETSKHVDLISPILFKNSDEDIVKEGGKRNYIVITVSGKDGEDCLSNTSFYKYIALEYLESLRKEYLSI